MTRLFRSMRARKGESFEVMRQFGDDLTAMTTQRMKFSRYSTLMMIMSVHLKHMCRILESDVPFEQVRKPHHDVLVLITRNIAQFERHDKSFVPDLQDMLQMSALHLIDDLFRRVNAMRGDINGTAAAAPLSAISHFLAAPSPEVQELELPGQHVDDFMGKEIHP